MSVLRSMFGNTAARSITEIVNRLGSAIFWILVARYLGPGGLGSIAFSLSLFTLFATITTLGLGSAVIRDVAKERSLGRKYFINTQALGVVASIVFSAIMMGIAVALRPKPDTFFATIIMALAIFPATGFYWSRSILWSFERLGYVAVARTAESIFKIAAGVAVLVAGYGVKEVAIVIVLSKVISFVLCTIFASRLVGLEFRLDRTLLRRLLRQAPSFSLIAIFNALFWSLSVILLTKLQGEVEAGIFSAAFKFVDICISFASAYGQALFPVASRISQSRPELFRILCQKSIKYILILSAATATGIAILAPFLIHMVYGSSMAQAIPVLQLLIWLIVPFGVVPILAYTLIINHLQNRDLLANASATVVLILMSIVLIPQWGAMGAATALLVGCITFFGVEAFSVHKRVFQFQISLRILNPIFSILALGSILILFKDMNVLIRLFIGGSFFIILLWVTGNVTKFERKLFKQIRSA